MTFWLFIAQFASLVLLLAIAYRPLGDYMAHTFTTTKDLGVERGIYRVIGVKSDSEQSWQAYLRGVLAFSLISVLFVYGLQRLQHWLPYSLGLPNVAPGLSFNTAISFMTNTNWQSYSPEQTVGYTVQMAGLAVQNFVSGAVGIAVAVALVRGFSRRHSATIGNFWVDLTRALIRIGLPMTIIFSMVLVAGGAIQNFNPVTIIHGVTGVAQNIPGGPVATQEVIKELFNNGGGFMNANSAHPYENPTAWTNVIEVWLMLVIPFSLARTFGKMVGDNRQGYAILAAMGILFTASLALGTLADLHGSGNSAIAAAGGAMEGKEQRLGILGTMLFDTTGTNTSTGAVTSAHDSMTPFGGGMMMLNMMLGEVSPGGVGAGLYGMLVFAVVAVFLAGLMIGRTPEYLGKKIGGREMKFASLYFLTMPVIVLSGTALSFVIPGVVDSVKNTSILNPGQQGFSEVLYAFTSTANNNGSAFGGLTANTPWFNAALGASLWLGRLVPIAFALALAGALAAQDRVPATPATLPTHRPQFVGLLVGTVLLVSAISFFPALALGPISEGLH